MPAGTDSSVRLTLADHIWGWKPHETQKKWLLTDAGVKVASCGRRWGKTEAAAVDAATLAILHPGSKQIIVSPTYDQSRLIFDHIERLMTGSRLTRGITKITRTPYPRLALGSSLIMARTADEDGRNLRGHSADRVIVDEAAFVRDSVISEVISPMLADRNGRLVMISTPFGRNHFYRAFMRGAGSDDGAACRSFNFPSWANPHISRQYIETQRQEISPRQFAVEYEAQFIDDSNCVFAWEDIEAAVSDSHAADADGVVVAGIDWARYSDYTAVVAMVSDERGCHIIGIDRFNKMGWDSQITRVAQFLKTHRVSCALADSTSIGDPLLEQLRARLWDFGIDVAVEGYTFSNRSKRDLIEHLSLKFAHRSITILPDEQLLRELQYYEYELPASGNVRMNGRVGIDDDLVIALALACKQTEGFAHNSAYLSQAGRMARQSW